MVSDPLPGKPRTPIDDSEVSGDDPRVLLLVESERNRELLVDALEDRYRIETATDPDSIEGEFDCCVLDRRLFGRAREAIRRARDASEVFLPFVLLVGRDASTDPEVWDVVDDVIDLPARRAELISRIDNVVERHRTSAELARRERQLEATVADLRMKERAMDEAPVGITISDPDRDDNPVIYTNRRFEELTGYDAEDVIGRNCRFLQGEETDPDTRAELRDAIDDRRPVSVDIVNYRKNGERFWNKLDIAPVRDGDDDLTHYVGFQTDITERKIRERRLEVLNRVLSHNLGNKMNLIRGHSELLEAAFEGSDGTKSLEKIDEAATELVELGEQAREIEKVLSETTTGHVIPLADRLKQITSAYEDRFPETEFRLSLPDDDACEVAAGGIVPALEEAVENAARHNDSETPKIEIRVSSRSADWIDIEIEDNGPGIPDREVEVLRTGETALYHADGLGLWLIYWVVSRAGGSMTVSDVDPSGTVLSISIPRHTNARTRET